MDRFRLGRRCGQVVVTAAGLVALIGGGALPAAAQTPVAPVQPAHMQPRTGPGFQQHVEVRDGEEHVDVNVCSTAIGAMQAHCDARIRTDDHAAAARPERAGQARPNGALGNGGAYDPSFLQSAYNVMALAASGAGAGQVVAIVDAYDSPSAQSDLADYRAYFGLPALPSCTTWPSSTRCFRKVNQSGAAGSYPSADAGWAQEIALDLDMVSAICPNCSILLVEASSNTYPDLTAAVNEAVALGANAVSNSYGGGEWSGEAGFDAPFNHAGVAITASSGDAGYGTEWPAASPYVTAVGGTSLNQALNSGTRSATETAWTGAGSGCSAYEPKPAWQKDSACANRTVADVSAVADPNTGVWVYETYSIGGWGILGGTSAASPIIASMYALAGNSVSVGGQLNSGPYSHAANLFDAVSGSNGACGGSYLCTSGVGYDGPTGLGSPNGMAAFANGAAAPAITPDFTLSPSLSTLTATRGSTSVSDTLTLSPINGYHTAVQLSLSGVPAGVNASLSTTSVTPQATSKMTVRATRSAVRGSYTLTVIARGSDGTQHTRAISLVVQ